MAGTSPDAVSGAIKGQVTTQRGEPVSDAAVMIRSGPQHPDIAPLTGDSGEYLLEGLLPGEYEVLVNPKDHPPQQKSVTVRASQVTQLDFTLGD